MKATKINVVFVCGFIFSLSNAQFLWTNIQTSVTPGILPTLKARAVFLRHADLCSWFCTNLVTLIDLPTFVTNLCEIEDRNSADLEKKNDGFFPFCSCQTKLTCGPSTALAASVLTAAAAREGKIHVLAVWATVALVEEAQEAPIGVVSAGWSSSAMTVSLFFY